MTYLLDTHVWLWMLADPGRLGRVRDVVEERSTRLLLSAASAWEIAIKVGRGRLALPAPVEQYVPARMLSTGVESLPILASHVVRVASLPHHHRDPFDRVLIAQSLAEGVPIITADSAFTAYDCELLLIE